MAAVSDRISESWIPSARAGDTSSPVLGRREGAVPFHANAAHRPDCGPPSRGGGRFFPAVSEWSDHLVPSATLERPFRAMSGTGSYSTWSKRCRFALAITCRYPRCRAACRIQQLDSVRVWPPEPERIGGILTYLCVIATARRQFAGSRHRAKSAPGSTDSKPGAAVVPDELTNDGTHSPRQCLISIKRLRFDGAIRSLTTCPVR